MIAAGVAAYGDRLDTVEGRVLACRRATEVIAALPQDTWVGRLVELAAAVDVLPETAIAEVLDAHQTWTGDPGGVARRNMAERLPQPALPPPPAPEPAAPVAATDRWAGLGNSVHPNITDDPGWPTLADSLDRAGAHGYDVTRAFPTLAARYPLPDEDTARVLHYRLLIDCPDAIDRAELALQRAAREGAAARQSSTGIDRLGPNRSPVTTSERESIPRVPTPPPPPAYSHGPDPGPRRGPSR